MNKLYLDVTPLSLLVVSEVLEVQATILFVRVPLMPKLPVLSSIVPVKVLPVGIMLLSSSRTVISVP